MHQNCLVLSYIYATHFPKVPYQWIHVKYSKISSISAQFKILSSRSAISLSFLSFRIKEKWTIVQSTKPSLYFTIALTLCIVILIAAWAFNNLTGSISLSLPLSLGYIVGNLEWLATCSSSTILIPLKKLEIGMAVMELGETVWVHSLSTWSSSPWDFLHSSFVLRLYFFHIEENVWSVHVDPWQWTFPCYLVKCTDLCQLIFAHQISEQPEFHIEIFL